MVEIPTVAEALNQFPTLKNIITVKKVQAVEAKDPKAPILYYLRRSMPNAEKVAELFAILDKNPKDVTVQIILDHIVRPYHILKHLDGCLSKIAKEPKLNTAIDHLLDSNAFWQGYCEIEVAANIKDAFGQLELEPSLANNKNVDVKFPVGEDDIYTEVTVPKQYYKVTEALLSAADADKAFTMEKLPFVTRAEEKILTELEHFAEIVDDVQSLIILNLNQCEFEDIDVEDALLGVAKLLVVTDQAGQMDVKQIREDWTAFSRDNRLAKIGAIVCYNRDFSLKGQVVYSKRVFVLSFDEAKYSQVVKLFSK